MAVSLLFAFTLAQAVRWATVTGGLVGGVAAGVRPRITAGSESRSVWAGALYGLSSAAVAGLTAWRLLARVALRPAAQRSAAETPTGFLS